MSGKLRTYLVDDEQPALKRLSRLLEATGRVEIIGSTINPRTALQFLAINQPDVVFLDVQMPKVDGFQVAASLTAPLPEIVFVTAHDQFALKAFEVHALDYLLKPYDEDRFQKVLERVRERRLRSGDRELVNRLQQLLADMQPGARYADRVLVNENERAFFVPVSSIDWVEGARNYVALHAGGKTHMLRGTLEGLSKRLDPSAFVRVNRLAIVRLDSIRELQPWFHGEYKIVMKDGETITWSRRYVTAGFPARILV